MCASKECKGMWGWPHSPAPSRLSGGCLPKNLLVLENDLNGEKHLRGYFPTFYEYSVSPGIFNFCCLNTMQTSHVTSSTVQEAD